MCVCGNIANEDKEKKRAIIQLLFPLYHASFSSVMCLATHFSTSLSLFLVRAFSTHERARMCSFFFSSWLPTHTHTHTLFALNNTYTYFFSSSSSPSSPLIHSMHWWCVYSTNYLIFIFVILLVDPSSIDTSSASHQQQANESTFSAHEHVPILDTIEHQQPSTPSSASSSTAAVLLNPTHLHHPPSHLRQTMPGKSRYCWWRGGRF